MALPRLNPLPHELRAKAEQLIVKAFFWLVECSKLIRISRRVAELDVEQT
jgi:hypothetical protein